MTAVHLPGFAYPVDPGGVRFWAAVADRTLTVSRCEDCGRHFAPFPVACPYCGSRALSVHPSSGQGSLYTWTVCHRAMDPMFSAEVPYVVGAVRLDEGAVLYSRMVEVDPADVSAGMAVELCWLRVEPSGLWMWAFRPRRAG